MSNDLTLLSPSSPGGRGDDSRWILLVRLSSSVFQRIPILGPQADQESEAKQRASESLGFKPEWIKVEPKSSFAKPAWVAANNKPKPKRARKASATRK